MEVRLKNTALAPRATQSEDLKHEWPNLCAQSLKDAASSPQLSAGRTLCSCYP